MISRVIITLWTLAFVLCRLAVPVSAQTAFNVIIPGTPPGGIGGACTATSYGYLMPLTGGSQIVTCSASTHLWTATVGGGTGTVTAVSVATANGVSGSVATATTTPAITITLGNITPTSVSTGTSPPSLTPGTGGAAARAEGTVPSVGAAVGVDVCYADSTQHGELCSYDNGAYLPSVRGPASWTTGRVVSTNGTNGGLLADAGFLAANVVQAVSPGAGICHFAGITQACTSSAVSLTADVSGVLPTANIAIALANQTSLRSNAMAAAAGDATIGQVIAHGAKALDFASTATGACATVITDTATGALSTDTIIFNANASIKAVTGYVPASTGGFSIAAYPSADTVNFEACNWTAGTVDPGSITVNWKVIR